MPFTIYIFYCLKNEKNKITQQQEETNYLLLSIFSLFKNVPLVDSRSIKYGLTFFVSEPSCRTWSTSLKMHEHY